MLYMLTYASCRTKKKGYFHFFLFAERYNIVQSWIRKLISLEFNISYFTRIIPNFNGPSSERLYFF